MLVVFLYVKTFGLCPALLFAWFFMGVLFKLDVSENVLIRLFRHIGVETEEGPFSPKMAG
jgi:hypothetical protein